MTVTAIIQMPFGPDTVDAGLDSLARMLPATRAYDGCHRVDVYRSREEPARVVLIEEWQSVDQHQAYVAWRESSGVLELMGPLLQGDVETTYLESATSVT